MVDTGKEAAAAVVAGRAVVAPLEEPGLPIGFACFVDTVTQLAEYWLDGIEDLGSNVVGEKKKTSGHCIAVGGHYFGHKELGAVQVTVPEVHFVKFGAPGSGCRRVRSKNRSDADHKGWKV